MSIYKNVPKISNAESIEDMLEQCSKLVEWGRYNLPEIRRAEDVAAANKLSHQQLLKLALALMIRSYVTAMEGWLEASQLNSMYSCSEKDK